VAGTNSWRLRGVAVLEAARGKGVGSAMMEHLLAHARARGGKLAWCNARINAVGFYEQLGFVREGGEFELPQIGTHVVMELPLTPDPR
jgi:ribosomal protein S18 acetylase RimI-like enzyme